MRTRTRLLLGFVAVHMVLSLLVGWTVWGLIDHTLRDQAEAKVGRVLAEGGFSLSPSVLTRMQALTGYRFRLLDAPEPRRPGTVQVDEGGRLVEVDYLTDEHRELSRAVIVATAVAMVAGVLVFAVVAWWMARQFAAPLERLAVAARTIGAGDLQRAVPVSGSAELRELAMDLDHMRTRLSELDRQHRQDERLATLGLFAATIAHEVRNPLSAVKLTIQMQARQRPEDQGLIVINEELERLDLIVDELLAFSKGMTVTVAPCNLREIANHVVRLLRRQAEHAGVIVTVEGDSVVSADAARMRQLLINLLLNAIQAQHGEGVVVVRVQSTGLEVVDSGPGVDPALVPRLFAPFSSDKVDGVGLGLHLAQAVAEAHGARLRYEKRSTGCAFIVEGLRRLD